MKQKVKFLVSTWQWLESLRNVSAFSSVGHFLYWTRNFGIKYLTPSHFIQVNGIMRIPPDWLCLLILLLPAWSLKWYSETLAENSVELSQFCSFPGDYKVRENIWTLEENLHLDFSGVSWICLYLLVWTRVLCGLTSFFVWAEAGSGLRLDMCRADGESRRSPGRVLQLHCESSTYFGSKGFSSQ